MWFRKSKAEKEAEAVAKAEVINKALADQQRTDELIEYVSSNTKEVETMAQTINSRLPKNHFYESLRRTMGEGAQPA